MSGRARNHEGSTVRTIVANNLKTLFCFVAIAVVTAATISIAISILQVNRVALLFD
jgi:hypothetical protein